MLRLIGGVIGGYLAGKFGIGAGGLLSSILIAAMGAVILVAIVRLISGGRARV